MAFHEDQAFADASDQIRLVQRPTDQLAGKPRGALVAADVRGGSAGTALGRRRRRRFGKYAWRRKTHPVRRLTTRQHNGTSATTAGDLAGRRESAGLQVKPVQHRTEKSRINRSAGCGLSTD